MNKNIIRFGTLAFALFAGAALIGAPATTATAKSIQKDGYFGGTWDPIGPRDNRHVRRYHRHYGPYGYYGPRYSYAPRYGYGPSYGRHGYGSRYHYGGPGFSITIR